MNYRTTAKYSHFRTSGLAIFGFISLSLCGGAKAETCGQAAFSAAVAESSATLHAMNERNKKALHQKLETLKARGGWSGDDFKSRAATLVKDDQTSGMDDRNKVILAEVSKLGEGETLSDQSKCAMLDRLKALLAEVVQNTDHKWRHIHQKTDASINSAPPGFATANSIK